MIGGFCRHPFHRLKGDGHGATNRIVRRFVGNRRVWRKMEEFRVTCAFISLCKLSHSFTRTMNFLLNDLFSPPVRWAYPIEHHRRNLGSFGIDNLFTYNIL